MLLDSKFSSYPCMYKNCDKGFGCSFVSLFLPKKIYKELSVMQVQRETSWEMRGNWIICFMFNNTVQLSLHIVNLLNIIFNTVHILLSIYCIVLFLFQTCKFFFNKLILFLFLFCWKTLLFMMKLLSVRICVCFLKWRFGCCDVLFIFHCFSSAWKVVIYYN